MKMNYYSRELDSCDDETAQIILIVKLRHVTVYYRILWIRTIIRCVQSCKQGLKSSNAQSLRRWDISRIPTVASKVWLCGSLILATSWTNVKFVSIFSWWWGVRGGAWSGHVIYSQWAAAWCAVMEVVRRGAGQPGTLPPLVSSQPLSPPHSDNSDTEHSPPPDHDHTHETDKPMDLSSGGLTQLFSGGSMTSDQPHPLITARRLADLVRQQHQQSDQRERESKRKWEDEDETLHDTAAAGVDASSRDWTVGVVTSAERRVESPGPGSPAGSVSSGDSGDSRSAHSSGGHSSSGGHCREEKRRRLDMLLNKKFDKMSSVLENPVLDKVVAMENPIMMSTPPPSEREPSPSSDSRRPSTESTGASSVTGERKNRRKQSQPGLSNPASPAPASISIRPHSDLFPPVLATSTPRSKHDHETVRDYSPASKRARPESPNNNNSRSSPVATKLFTEEKENKDALKNQLLQVTYQTISIHHDHHLALQMQLGGLAGLGGGSPPPELMKALQYNPLLYYSYYAHMITALQTQQKLLESQATTNNNNNNNIKDILSPLKHPNKEPSQVIYQFIIRCLQRIFLFLILISLNVEGKRNSLFGT